MTIARFQKTVLGWYKSNRRDMPWRNTKDPYKILVSEIMLQQTQIPRVLPKYKEFLKAFPTLEALAKAPDKKLLKVWAGLGYWRRAKYLKEAANIITKEYGGKFPKDARVLETLPGIGPYTARAVACFAFNKYEPFIDTNIRRVYLHFFFPGKTDVPDKEILTIAQKALVHYSDGRRNYVISPKEWHYALFDYGAVALKRHRTINKRSRTYTKQSKFEGSFRSYRTKVVKFLLAQPKNRATKKQLEAFLKKELQNSSYTPIQIIDALLKDHLIKKSKTHYSI